MILRFIEFQKKWNAEKKKLVTAGNFYAIDKISAEELKQYKSFKDVDGTSYYREQNGKPVWFDRQFYGFDCCEVRTYEREDGSIGFKAVNTMVDAHEMLAEQCEDPIEKARLLREANLIKLSGKPLVINTKAKEQDAEEVEEFEEEEENSEL